MRSKQTKIRARLYIARRRENHAIGWNDENMRGRIPKYFTMFMSIAGIIQTFASLWLCYCSETIFLNSRLFALINFMIGIVQQFSTIECLHISYHLATERKEEILDLTFHLTLATLHHTYDSNLWNVIIVPLCSYAWIREKTKNSTIPSWVKCACVVQSSRTDSRFIVAFVNYREAIG